MDGKAIVYESKPSMFNWAIALKAHILKLNNKGLLLLTWLDKSICSEDSSKTGDLE